MNIFNIFCCFDKNDNYKESEEIYDDKFDSIKKELIKKYLDDLYERQPPKIVDFYRNPKLKPSIKDELKK